MSYFLYFIFALKKLMELSTFLELWTQVLVFLRIVGSVLLASVREIAMENKRYNYF